MRMNGLVVKLAVGAFVTGALVVGSMAYAKGKPQPGGCPRDIQCPDIYDPVMCSDGIVYPNSCYAYAACATGCSGGGGI